MAAARAALEEKRMEAMVTSRAKKAKRGKRKRPKKRKGKKR
jgi:hypothetical protein